MALFRPVEGEVVRADLTSPLHTLTFPTLELILVTGLSWMLIGWLDQPGMDTDPQLRNAVLLVWLVNDKVNGHAPAHEIIQQKLPCKSDVLIQRKLVLQGNIKAVCKLGFLAALRFFHGVP